MLGRASGAGPTVTSTHRELHVCQKGIAMDMPKGPHHERAPVIVRDEIDDTLHDQLVHAHKMEVVARLAGGILHDFRNLLQVILGTAECLRDEGRKRGEDVAKLGDIVRAAEVARELAEGLLALTLSRPMARAAVLVDVNELVRELDALLAPVIPRTVVIDLRLADTLTPVRGDKCQLQQVIMNLVLNARDAMPEGGRLTIETGEVGRESNPRCSHVKVPAGEYVRLSIADTGTGMGGATMRHLYEPFFTTKGAGRTGLGLSIVYDIVTSHGGSIECSSRSGQGTVFQVLLPACRAARPASASTPGTRRRHGNT